MTDRAATGRIVRAVPNIVIALFALVCAIGLWRVLAVIGLHVPFDPNEGWNAYLAAAAMSGHPLYPDARAYLVNNYPPLSFYVVGFAGRLADNIVAGRLIALLAFLGVAGGIFRAARLMGSRVMDALPAGLLLMAWLIVGSDYVGMDDPQLLGHALQIAALLLVLKKSPNDIAAAVLFALALFVKHNLVAMPVAVGLWLLLEDRVRARRFVGAGFAFFLLELVAFRLVYGSSLLSHLASARIYSIALLMDNLSQWLVWGTVPLLIAVSLAITSWRDAFVRLATLYAGLAILIGIAFSGGAGVDANVFFDADIALALCVALAFNHLAEPNGPWRALAAASLLLPLAFGLYETSSEEDWRDRHFWVHPMADEASRNDIAFIGSRPGRALCEMLSYCYWAGKPAEVDMFNVGQQFATGARSDDALVRAIETHTFATLQFDTLEPFALGPRVKAAVLGAYRIDHADDGGVFFVPR